MESTSVSRVSTVNFSLKDGFLVSEAGPFDPPSIYWRKCLEDNCEIMKLAIDSEDENEHYLLPAIYVPIIFMEVETGYYLRSLKGRKHSAFKGAAPFFSLGMKRYQKTMFGVEGVLDAYAIYKANFSVVAFLSNAIGKYAVRMLKVLYKKRYFDQLIIIYDSDLGEGHEGAKITAKKMNGVGVSTGIFPTPFGAKDPGELYGDPRLSGLLDSLDKMDL